MTIGIISHVDCEKHDTGQGHPECAERVQVVREAIKHYPCKQSLQFYDAPIATRDQLAGIHDGKYVDWIFSIAPEGESIFIDADTVMSRDTLKAAQLAAGAVIFAVDLVMKGGLQAAFCNIRPPGHHAEREKAMGFCFFNNVAVGVQHAMAQHGVKRVAIIDFDAHHGNGTQAIFQNNKEVLFCSSFEHPQYPGYDEENDNAHILSVPLPAGTKGDVFRKKVQEKWFQAIAAHQPDFIFISAGFDAHEKDPVANLALQVDDYVWLTQEIATLAKKHCQGRIVSVLEGGYSLDALAECVPQHIDALV